MTMRKTAVALVFAAGLASRASAATPIPNTFTAGTPARAADVNANFQFVMDRIAEALPTGTVLPFAGPLDTAVPPGFLACDGAEYATTEYPALFGVIGNAYGVASSGKFKVPDLRGEFIRGVDDMGTLQGAGNVDPSRTLGSPQGDAFQGHAHVDGFAGVNGNATFGVATTATLGNLNTQNGQSTANHAITSGATQADGTNGTPHTATETRPRNVALNYIIRT
jgi:microcystin-dependent protein